jgi:hypothetical protein
MDVLARLAQASTNIFLAQAIDPNHLVARSLTAFQCDCSLRSAQFFCQKPEQGSVRFSFYRWCPQLDLDRLAILSHNLINFCVWNDVNLNCCHCSMPYPRVHFPIDKRDSIPAQKVLWTRPN